MVASYESMYNINAARCEKLLYLYLDQSFMSKPAADKKLLTLFKRGVCKEKPTWFFTHSCEMEKGQIDHCQQLTLSIASKYFDLRVKYNFK